MHAGFEQLVLIAAWDGRQGAMIPSSVFCDKAKGTLAFFSTYFNEYAVKELASPVFGGPCRTAESFSARVIAMVRAHPCIRRFGEARLLE